MCLWFSTADIKKKLLFTRAETFHCNKLQQGRGKADEEDTCEVSVE